MKNPDTVFQFQSAAVSSSAGNTIVKNSHVYGYKNGTTYTTGTQTIKHVFFQPGSNEYYNYYQVFLVSETPITNEKWTQFYGGHTDGMVIMDRQTEVGYGARYNAFIETFHNYNFSQTVADNFVELVLNDSVYSEVVDDTRKNMNKSAKDCYSTASTASSDAKKYTTEEEATITQLSLQGALFPTIAAQYNTTTSKQMALSSSLSANGLTLSSTIPYKSWKQNDATYSISSVAYFVEGYKYFGNGKNSFGANALRNITKKFNYSEYIATTTPANMITQATGATYANGNGSRLSNGMHYNTANGYAANNIYVVPSGISEAGYQPIVSNGTLSLLPEFVES